MDGVEYNAEDNKLHLHLVVDSDMDLEVQLAASLVELEQIFGNDQVSREGFNRIADWWRARLRDQHRKSQMVDGFPF